ncbi:hypothetical protein D1970_02005 [Mesobacillus zeae]|uniref:Peptidoglycan binding domain-containing protein n=2 Tax=Mesobacillus zeae TaxID=1917180 RepID=A0A398BKS2_9BACI|nr:hypothetical protein D1970_02005 [Mesobacillus zeae]
MHTVSAASPPFIETDSITVRYLKKEAATVSKEEFSLPVTDLTFADTDKIADLSKKMENIVYKAPIDASLDSDGNIIPEKNGTVLDQAAFTASFLQSFYSSEEQILVLPVKPMYARVDSELLANIKTKQIGHYVTTYNNHNWERSHNISLAAKAIDNKVVFPGETFSFNSIVGQRTEARGYKPAPVIVKGELSEGVGGGICQVSSTLYNAVDFSGLKVLRRYKHSKEVPYVPPGRDAAVSWAGPDFIFKNEYKQPVLIKAKAASGRIAVRIFSSDSIEIKKK